MLLQDLLRAAGRVVSKHAALLRCCSAHWPCLAAESRIVIVISLPNVFLDAVTYSGASG
jgi:hypothetical protein